MDFHVVSFSIRIIYLCGVLFIIVSLATVSLRSLSKLLMIGMKQQFPRVNNFRESVSKFPFPNLSICL
ncbi:hypothetical protein OIU78_021652 [Salix suchowensis]|nr:hypothetical protein OIU78_021652 [Salix suchowensis]